MSEFSPVSLTTPTTLLPGVIYTTDRVKEMSFGDHVFSNDGPIPEGFIDQLSTKTDGLALAIGSGAFSLYDKHRLTQVVVDYDRYAIIIQSLVGQAIKCESGTAAAQERVIEQGSHDTGLRRDYLRQMLRREAAPQRLGELHWTRNFEAVQDSIHERGEPSYVISDLRSKQLAASLKVTAAQNGLIKFFNPTNVHNHLAAHLNSMRFLSSLPFANDSLVLFSDAYSSSSVRAQDGGVALWREVSQGMDEYLSYTQYEMED